MARRFALYATCLSLSFSLLSTTTAATETTPVHEEGTYAVAGSHLVWFADGYLTVRVQDAPLGELLDEIAGKSGFTVERYVALNQRITVEFHRLLLEQALRRILRHRSFVLEYAVAQPRALWVLPQGEEEYAAERRGFPRTNTTFSANHAATEISTWRATLDSEDPEKREEAAAVLGESRHAEAVAPLTLALADGEHDVREAAVVSLAKVGGAEAVQALAIALRDQDPRVREEAVDALGKIGGENAAGLLQQALADEVEYVREAAAEILEELKDRKQ